jgi:threonine dehydrogenase-like Zn-dependent dehydrogenase
MKTFAVRMYGKNKIKLEQFDLPSLREDEILAHIISDSICKSTYKTILVGSEHIAVPNDLIEQPVIIGHELCGEIMKVGKKWRKRFKPGMKITFQPKVEHENQPKEIKGVGYSYPYMGGAATYVVLPSELMELDCVLEYSGYAFFQGSLAEPVSCIIRAFRANYHCDSKTGAHCMGIAEGGNLAILAGGGPMGLAAIDYAIHGDRKPNLLVVTCTNSARLNRAELIYTVHHAADHGVILYYVNTKSMRDPVSYLLELTNGRGYDDVFVFAPIKKLFEQADQILGEDGCLNCFAGPPDHNFFAECNFYNIHYHSHHILGSLGTTSDDMRTALRLMSDGVINPAAMITHIGGLNSVVKTTLHLPSIPGGKKLIYTNIDLELTAIDDFKEKGKSSPLFAVLNDIVVKNDNLWCLEAERYLLSNSKKIS